MKPKQIAQVLRKAIKDSFEEIIVCYDPAGKGYDLTNHKINSEILKAKVEDLADMLEEME